MSELSSLLHLQLPYSGTVLNGICIAGKSISFLILCLSALKIFQNQKPLL